MTAADPTKRRWNWHLWAGFGLVLAGLLSYIPVFAQFPITRDIPWVNLLMFAAGLALLVVGLLRAYRRPELYRGRVTGAVLAVLSVLGIFFFSYGLFYAARQLPESTSAPRVGQKAPDFTLPDQDGTAVALSDLLAKSNGALLIFYRGHW
jgi:hypothetical protein